MRGWPRRAGRALRDFFAVQVELHERLALRDRPWEEDLLHWSADGTLHGSIPPPPGRRGTTRGGWCPGLAAELSKRSPRTAARA